MKFFKKLIRIGRKAWALKDAIKALLKKRE